jgi:hypothetical protein
VDWLQAATFHALQRIPERDAALTKLVALRPLYEADASTAHPELRTALEAARKRWQAAEGVTVGEVALSDASVVVPLDGVLKRARTVDVFARPGGSVPLRHWSAGVEGTSVAVKLDDARFWESAAEAGSLDVVVEVRDDRGVALARVGDAVTPRPIAVTAAHAAAARAALRAPSPEPPPREHAEAAPVEKQPVSVAREAPRMEPHFSFGRFGLYLLGAVATPSCLSMLACGVTLVSVPGMFILLTQNVDFYLTPVPTVLLTFVTAGLCAATCLGSAATLPLWFTGIFHPMQPVDDEG